MRFCMLASGSSGNAALIQANGFGLMIDAGIGPRVLASRLKSVGASWPAISAVVLTHTHGDHWKERTLQALVQHKIPMYAHPSHQAFLRAVSPAFGELDRAGLVRSYSGRETFALSPSLECQPLPVCHDSRPTFGFRLMGKGMSGFNWSIGYLADLGCWSRPLARALANIDLLALEFNHDVDLERRSRRPIELIQRVLSDEGHLSNDQAAGMVNAVIESSEGQGPRHLVQLHLSQECNTPAMACETARTSLEAIGYEMTVHTARQDEPTPMLQFDPCPATGRYRLRRRAEYRQHALPGLD